MLGLVTRGEGRMGITKMTNKTCFEIGGKVPYREERLVERLKK